MRAQHNRLKFGDGAHWRAEWAMAIDDLNPYGYGFLRANDGRGWVYDFVAGDIRRYAKRYHPIPA